MTAPFSPPSPDDPGPRFVLTHRPVLVRPRVHVEPSISFGGLIVLLLVAMLIGAMLAAGRV